MLVKCVCSNCSHSYLADDQVGSLTCPRCGTDNHGSRNASDIADAPMGAPTTRGTAMGGPTRGPVGGGMEPGYDVDPGNAPPEVGVYDPYAGDEPFGMDFGESRFAPQAPPPMYVTGERMLKGAIFGSVATVVVGLAVGGALAAVQVVVPVVAAVILALVAGATTRYGFGGRTAQRTTGRALGVLLIVLLMGNVALLAGSWAVERFTGVADRDADGVADVTQTRSDLESGLRALVGERARNRDTGASMILDQRIAETELLQQLGDAELEDYLWVQQAEVNQPLLAYVKLRVTSGPIVRLPKGSPIRLPSPAPAGILLGELILALFLAMRAVSPR